jgi:hypothetical protein
MPERGTLAWWPIPILAGVGAGVGRLLGDECVVALYVHAHQISHMVPGFLQPAWQLYWQEGRTGSPHYNPWIAGVPSYVMSLLGILAGRFAALRAPRVWRRLRRTTPRPTSGRGAEPAHACGSTGTAERPRRRCHPRDAGSGPACAARRPCEVYRACTVGVHGGAESSPVGRNASVG